MKPKHLLASLVLSLFVSTLTSYTQAEDIKVGALLCLSGACADTGNNSLKGIQLAIEELEKSTDDKIELVVENSDELNGSAPVSAYHSIRRKLDNAFIIGPSWSVGGMSVAPIAAKDPKVLLMSPSLGVKEFNESGDNIFNIWPHDDTGTKALAQRAYASGHKKISIIAHTSAWDLTQVKTFKTEFERLGGEVSPYIEYQPSEIDLKTYALKILKSKSDAIYLSNYIQLGLFTKELKKYGYKGKKYSSYVDKIQIEQSQGNLEGVEFSFQPEGSKEFTDAFVKNLMINQTHQQTLLMTHLI
jgi:ABC-type branched-subunit amino acid transport system substrate-binding protein